VRRPSRSVVWVVLVAATCATACRAGSQGGGGADGAGTVEAPVTVAASLYPLVEVARLVGRPLVKVRSLSPVGTGPHDPLTAKEIGALAEADLAVVVGGGFQPDVEQRAGRRSGPTLRALEVPGAGDPADPRVWLDPVLMRRVVDTVAGALAEIRPTGKQQFLANAKRYKRGLLELDQLYRSRLASCSTRTFATSDPAFGRLAVRYRLVPQVVTDLIARVEPDSAGLADLKRTLRGQGIRAVLVSAPTAAEVVPTLDRAEITTQSLDRLEAVTEADQIEDVGYMRRMKRNLSSLRVALRCV